MRVVIGNEVYDSSEDPIMVILEEKDKAMIRKMKWDEHKFASFPACISEIDIRAWMMKYSDNKK